MSLLDVELHDFTRLEMYLASSNHEPHERRIEEPVFSTNYYIAPGYEPLRMLQEIEDQVNGKAGSIDQQYLYVTDKGARAWCKVSGQEDYAARQGSLPMEAVVDALIYRLEKTHFKQDSLDILCLGSGEAKTERRLVQVLRKRTKIRTIRLFLLDISSQLLDTGYQRAKEEFADDPGIEVIGFRGSFYHLQRYGSLLASTSGSNRMLLVTMLGHTFGNLPHEVDFLRYNLGAFGPNTLLLLDLILPYAASDQPGAIASADPWLSGDTKWWKPVENILAVPILGYRKGVSEGQIQFKTVLDNRTAYVPRSYVVEMKAVIDNNVELTMQRFKRHDPTGVQDVFLQENWSLIRSFPWNENRWLACLFQKR